MGQDFKLDTSAFANSANATKKLAEKLDEVIEKTDNAVDALFDSWAGQGRNAFEKKYHIFERQISDIRTGLWDLYEDIVEAEEKYIETDLKSEKGIDGVFSDYSRF